MTHIDGFVPLADYDDRRGDGGKERGHTADYKALRKAIEDGDVDGWQHGGSGRWLINKMQADRHLLAISRQPAEPSVTAGEKSARVIERRLERIESTLFSIYTLLKDRDVVLDQPQWHPTIEEAVDP